jgi:hypothetical protein
MRSESAPPLHRTGAEDERLSYADDVISRARLDQFVALMGGGTLLFGVAPCLAPGWFARLFDIPVAADPRLLVMVRSVGIRDAAIGLGLLLNAVNHQDYAAWLAARVAADAGDSLAVALAIGGGARQPRFLGLGLLALGATLTGLTLHRLAVADR